MVESTRSRRKSYHNTSVHRARIEFKIAIVYFVIIRFAHASFLTIPLIRQDKFGHPYSFSFSDPTYLKCPCLSVCFMVYGLDFQPFSFGNTNPSTLTGWWFFFLSLISYSNLCMSASGCDCDVSPPTTSSSPLESNALYKLCYFKIELIYIYLYRFVSVKFKQRVFNQCILY